MSMSLEKIAWMRNKYPTASSMFANLSYSFQQILLFLPYEDDMERGGVTYKEITVRLRASSSSSLTTLRRLGTIHSVDRNERPIRHVRAHDLMKVPEPDHIRRLTKKERAAMKAELARENRRLNAPALPSSVEQVSMMLTHEATPPVSIPPAVIFHSRALSEQLELLPSAPHVLMSEKMALLAEELHALLPLMKEMEARDELFQNMLKQLSGGLDESDARAHLGLRYRR